MLNRLAQGQSLAVLVGTDMPYKIATMAEAGPIKGAEAGKLSAERKVELMQVMRELTRDWGIAFDVEIKAVTGSARSLASALFESRPLVAHFTPRKFAVHGGQRLSPVMSNTMFRDRVKELHDPLAADIKARCTEAFGIEDPVDVKIQERLKDDLACVVRTDLEGVEALAKFLLATGRKEGLTLAVHFLENYLAASGAALELSLGESPEFDLGRIGAADNVERFRQLNLISPEPSNPAFTPVEDISKKPDVRVTRFVDDWKSDVNLSLKGMERFFEAGSDNLRATISAFLATGRSSVTSSGDFLLRRQGDRIFVEGKIAHVWSDVDGYNFNVGTLFHEESQVLERHMKAKPFKWTVKWEERVLAELQIENAFSPNATRRQISFETSPISP